MSSRLILFVLLFCCACDTSIPSETLVSSLTFDNQFVHVELKNDELQVTSHATNIDYLINGARVHFITAGTKSVSYHDLSSFPTTPSKYDRLATWQPSTVSAKRVLHVIGMQHDSVCFNAVSDTLTNTVFVSLPTKAWTDPETGIMVAGNSSNPKNPEWTGNFFGRGKKWERRGHLIANIDSAKTNQSVGVRIHGLRSPALPQKTIKLFAREGNKSLGPSFFDQKRILLRTPMSSWRPAWFIDSYISEIAVSIGLESNRSKLTTLYLNGTYWGSYTINEKLDEVYLSRRYNHPKKNLHVIEGANKMQHGSPARHQAFVDWLETNEIEQADGLESVKQYMDVNNLIDNFILQTFFCNHDWPGNNMSIWHANDGPMRYIAEDFDACFYGAKTNFLEIAASAGANKWPKSDWSTYVFRRLLRNETFRDSFELRYNDLLASTLSAEALIERLNRFENEYESAVQNQSDRWHFPKTKSAWHRSLIKLRLFALNRPIFAKKHLTEFMSHYD